MSKLFALTKVSFINGFNLLGNSTKNRKRNTLLFGLVLLLVFASATFTFVTYAQIASQFAGSLINGVPARIAYLNLCMISTTLIIFMSSIFSSQGYLFKSKDFDFLLSSPISKRQILLSKFFAFYLSNFIFSAICFGGIIIGYYMFFAFSISSLIMFVVAMILLPLGVMTVGSLIGFVSTIISSKFKAGTAINYIVITVFLIVFFAFYYSSQSLVGSTDIGALNYSFWFGRVLANCIGAINFVDILYFIAICLVLPISLLFIVSPYYTKIIEISNKTYKSNKQVDFKALKTKNKFWSLLLKDLNNYVKTPIYVFNTFACVLMISVMAVILCTQLQQNMSSMFDMPKIISIIVPLIVAVLCMGIGISNTSCSSISLEGKQFWITKSSPISAITFCLSKIFLCFLASSILPCISFIVVAILCKLSIGITMLSILLMLLFGLFSAFLGLFVNMAFPKLDWVNETQVVKQGLSVLMNMLFNFVIVIVLGVLYYFVLSVYLPIWACWLIIIGILAIAIFVMYYVLKTRGEKKLVKIMEN